MKKRLFLLLVLAAGLSLSGHAAILGQTAMQPKLLGIQQAGHYSGVFSPYGLIAGWEMSPDPYSLSLDTSGALALGENLLIYAVTQ